MDTNGEAFAQLLDEVGTDNAVVLGGMWMGEPSLCRAHFAVAAIIDADEVTVAECVALKRAALKAIVKKGIVSGVHLLAALERYTTNEAEDKPANVKTWKKVLQTCWEYEIVAEEDIRAWCALAVTTSFHAMVLRASLTACRRRACASLLLHRALRNDDERAAAKLQVQTKDAQDLRERSLGFFQWLEAGEE